MQFDSIIFDLDGTLWDCTPATAARLNGILKKHGLLKTVSTAEVRSITGMTSAQWTSILFADIEREHWDSLLEAFRTAERGEEFGESALYKGVPAGLLKLKEKFDLFLVSNCSIPYLETFQSRTSISSQFKDLECHGRSGVSKAETIKQVVARNNLKSPCYVGDTILDHQAANGAGIPFFHVDYGFGKPIPETTVPSFANFDDLANYLIQEN